MGEDCIRGHYVTRHTDPDDYDYTEEVFVRDCDVVTITTFEDYCRACRKTIRYPNANDWPEENLLRGKTDPR